MRLRVIRGENGEAEQELVPSLDDVLSQLEAEASMPLTMQEKRQRLALFEASQSSQRNEREAIFDDYLRRGPDALVEARAQAVGTDSAGGFLTPASFADRFTASLQAYDELFDVATLVETDKGTAFSFPMDDDTQAVATIVAENAQSLTNSPVTFGNVAFNRCPTWRGGHIVASMELAADSAFPLSNVLADLFGRRFARGVGAQFVTNLIADSTVGATTASPTIITGSEIIDLIASCDPAYQRSGGFLLRDATTTALRKQTANTAGNFLGMFGRDSSGRKTLFDYPIYESPSMPAIGASAKCVAFGDLSRFIRRQVRDSLTMKTYTEKYATSGGIGWEAFLRCDGKLAKATNSPLPIRLLQCHS
jgi:HK97 family phage major capsid protein